MSDVLTIKRGDDEAISVVFTNEDGSAMSLTGCTVWLAVRERSAGTAITDDLDAPISKVYTNLDITTGVLPIELSGTETDIEPGTYLAEVQLKTADGKYHSSAIFEVEVIDDIVRSR